MTTIQTPAYYKQFKNNIKTQKGKTWCGKRKKYVGKYGWTIPNKKFIKEILTQDNILEIGAGKGYIAYETNKYENVIYPIDIQNYENSWVNVDNKSLTEINTKYNTILLCWPPANEPLAYESIKKLQPKIVYFAGVPYSTITGNKQFHIEINKKYSVEKQIDIPSWLLSKKEKLIKYVKK